MRRILFRSAAAQNVYFANSGVSSESPAGFVGCERVTSEHGGRMGVLSETSRPEGLFSAVADCGVGFFATLGLGRLRALGRRTFFAVREAPFTSADDVVLPICVSEGRADEYIGRISLIIKIKV